ncbi:pyridoxamine 5'-phosphate oxidase family protein [Nocardia bovistercoris]|uniref:Pyridoxamine 5'-phosphate oxidase family protein n=1 Tax=Nocardia bovistercoris TaxID=2785916 RepID=A0A931IG88_9NOCA|nr:pyridoxamine 5'-phosphate oxidase family protein [Nocardia bovistercoris]MBH0779118.1 pyridoxamine 5'-phosphate oxidase family protein [Nocardia bovistercoris]
MPRPTSANADQITDPADLRHLLGEPMPRAVAKERIALHARDREWIAASPFIVVATSDADGNCDASPKGDPAGFVQVIDDTTLAIPERPGNRRADGYLNILANPHIGVIFLIPGRSETLRVNGSARLVRDAGYFDDMVVKGHRPILAVEVAVEQIFFHCGKAFMRSHLWDVARQPAHTLPSHAQITKDVIPDSPETVAELERYYAPENYRAKLYRD